MASTKCAALLLFALVLLVVEAHAVDVKVEGNVHAPVPSPKPSVRIPPKPSVTLPPKPSVTLPPKPSVTLPPKRSVTLPPKPSVALPPKPSVTLPPKPSVTLPKGRRPSPKRAPAPSPKLPSLTMPPKPSVTLPKFAPARSPRPSLPSKGRMKSALVKVLMQNEAKRAVTITSHDAKKKAKDVKVEPGKWALVGEYEVTATSLNKLLLTVTVSSNSKQLPGVKKAMVIDLLKKYQNKLEGKKTLLLTAVEEKKTTLLGKKQQLLKIIDGSQVLLTFELAP